MTNIQEPPIVLRKFFFYSILEWEKLDPDDLGELQAHKSVIKLKKNELVFLDSERPKGVYILLKGKVKIFKQMPDGSDQILYIYTPGEVFGFRPLLSHELNPTSASALEPSLLEFIPAQVFMNVLDKSHALTKMILINLSREFVIWINRLILYTQKDVRKRLALVLLILNEKFKSPNSKLDTSSIHISRTDLAAFIGASLETLVRALKKFSVEGLVKVTGKNIVLLDIDKMIEIAEIR